MPKQAQLPVIPPGGTAIPCAMGTTPFPFALIKNFDAFGENPSSFCNFFDLFFPFFTNPRSAIPPLDFPGILLHNDKEVIFL
jgi:hypothetical protein